MSAFLSSERVATAHAPSILSHTFTQCKDSILALANAKSLLFAGTQRGSIYVWDIDKLQLIRKYENVHQGHILALHASQDSEYLFSAGADGMLRIWRLASSSDTELLWMEFHVHIAEDSGDVRSLAYCDATKTVYLGCTNTSIQWFCLDDASDLTKSQLNLEFKLRHSRFFGAPKELESEEEVYIEGARSLIQDDYVLTFAHTGFIYGLLGADKTLYSVAGSGDVKIWDVSKVRPELKRTLNVVDSGILSLFYQNGFLYCGTQDGEVKVLDLETYQCVRTLLGHEADVLCITGINDTILSGSADGRILKWDTRNYECIETISSHTDSVLCFCSFGGFMASGGADEVVHLWDIRHRTSHIDTSVKQQENQLLAALKAFIAIPSVSGRPEHREDCRRAARFLKSLFKELGSDTEIVPGAEGKNPLVVAKFKSTKQSPTDHEPKTVLFYGHYDVQPALKKKWSYPPWELTGSDGYLYGRGVTDDKGPILATMFAVASLYRSRQLNCNVCFLIEGEEESGSSGFYDAVERHREYFGKVDVILISNSYWIDDETPCLTYGLRGVIHAEVEIMSPVNADVHSGVMGGALNEPLQDIVKVVSQLVSADRHVLIPGFNDSVRPTCPAEEAMFAELAAYARTHVVADGDDMTKAQMLMAKWRFPTLTVHNIEVSGPSSNTVIPRSCKAIVSMRIVPDQDLNDVINKFQRYIKKTFIELQSKNTLKITVGHRANWWLGNTGSPYFKAAERAIEKEWKIAPLHIREGGSIPAIPWLESVLQADAVHIPMGQATDNAHLPNERLRLQNLMAGQRVVENFLSEVGAL